jgi:hypothetical protein
MTSKPDTITVSKKRSRSASRAATTKAPMAHPHNAPAPVAASATAIEPAAPAPSPATVTDPLICSPLTQEEPRCRLSIGFMYSILIKYYRYPCLVWNGASYRRQQNSHIARYPH